jgi:hypothetical protein
MVWREGEVAKTGRRLPYEESGFCLNVSEAGILEAQAENVVRFLEDHNDDLRRIVALEGVDHPHLDFGYDCRLHEEGIFMQGDYLPVRLMALCGELGLAVMLSLYPTD